MAHAIQLARRGLHATTRPNPRVGCVLVKDGTVIGEGWHQIAGEGHAEVNALADCVAQHGAEARHNSTAYVTLEPCSHTGKTPPCSQALIDAGISRVVYGTEDPNPAVSGSGLEQLRTAGISVAGPVLEHECLSLNPGFNKRMTQGLPRVRCKLAMSLDGRTAMANGESQWITGPDAREDVQTLRAESCAIITGIGTVLMDDPALTVRSDKLPQAARAQQPLRLVLDSQGRCPDNASILNQPGTTRLINDTGNLHQLLQQLAEQQCNEVLIESGATLAGAFISAGLVDELIIYMAPKLLGSDARPLLDLPLTRMNEQVELDITDVRAIGNDWRITATPILSDPS